MSISYPFPTNLYRVIGEDPITIIAPDYDGEPTVVCVRTTSAFDRAAALVLLERNPESFVLSDGLRLSPNGQVEPLNPVRPHYAGELRLSFDVEWVELGPQPRVHVFVHTEQEWKDARQAMAHLLHLGRLSPLSYVESDHTGQDQGVFVRNVDGEPHGPGIVAMIREAAYCRQNGLDERPECDKEDYEMEDNDEWEEDPWDEEDDEELGDAEYSQGGDGDEWGEEEELAKQPVSKVDKLTMLFCGTIESEECMGATLEDGRVIIVQQGLYLGAPKHRRDDPLYWLARWESWEFAIKQSNPPSCWVHLPGRKGKFDRPEREGEYINII